ncbi:MAG: hypothetical protein ACJ780_19055 [Solirubrobacteraceae bacterium]
MTHLWRFWDQQAPIGKAATVVLILLVLWLAFFVLSFLLGSSSVAGGVGH